MNPTIGARYQEILTGDIYTVTAIINNPEDPSDVIVVCHHFLLPEYWEGSLKIFKQKFSGDNAMNWGYRVSKQRLDDDTEIYAIREFYRDKNGNLSSWTHNESTPIGTTLEELKGDFELMALALDQEPIDIGDIRNGEGDAPSHEVLINNAISKLQWLRDDLDKNRSSDEAKDRIVKGLLLELGGYEQ